MTGALAALIFGLSYGQQHVAAAALGVGFVRAEQKATAPMLPLAILAAPARRAALIAMLLIGAVLADYVYFVSLYLQRVQGFSPLATGLALIPSTATVVLTSTLVTRRLLTRFTIKQVLLAGLVAMGAGQLWLAQISPGGSYATAVLPGLVLTALGIGRPCPPPPSRSPAASSHATRASPAPSSPAASRSERPSGSPSSPPPQPRAPPTRLARSSPGTGSRSS